MRQVHFHQEAFTHFTGWATADPALFERLTRLIVEAARSPFEGIGKPRAAQTPVERVLVAAN